MSTTLEQGVAWFATPLNFTQTVRMRRLRRTVGKRRAEWCAAWYAHMRDLAKQARVFGTFTTDVESFVDSYGGHVPEPDAVEYSTWLEACVELWRAFERVGLVHITDGDPADLDNTFRVEVLDYAETNRGRAERLTDDEKRARDAARKRLSRARCASCGERLTEHCREHAMPCCPGTCPASADTSGRANATNRNDAANGIDNNTPADITQQYAGNVRDVRAASADASASSLTGQDRTGQDNHPPLPPADDEPSAMESIAPDQRTTAGQIRRAQRQLGDVSVYITALIARSNDASRRTLTDRQELDRFWRPAAAAMTDHGRPRLMQALTEAAREHAVSFRFVDSVLNRLAARDNASRANNPDIAGSGDWDDLPPTFTVTAGKAAS